MLIGVLISALTALVIALATGAFSAAKDLVGGNADPPTPRWSPSRNTYSCRTPSPCVGFGRTVILNALINNPNYGDPRGPIGGDERNFLLVKPATQSTTGGWRDVLAVKPGDEVLLRQYVSNGSYSTVAEDARASLQIPPESGRHLLLTARNSATNASPSAVTDQVRLDSTDAIAADFVAGSAKVYGNAFAPAGAGLSDFYPADGALLGYDKLDGRLRPAYEGNLIVTARVRIRRG